METQDPMGAERDAQQAQTMTKRHKMIRRWCKATKEAQNEMITMNDNIATWCLSVSVLLCRVGVLLSVTSGPLCHDLSMPPLCLLF